MGFFSSTYTLQMVTSCSLQEQLDKLMLSCLLYSKQTLHEGMKYSRSQWQPKL